MMNDKATIYLTSLVGFGAIILTLITTFLHTTLIGYMVILMVICMVLILLTLKGHFAHHVENLEKLAFIITFMIIVCLFIIRFRPI
ncbi:hypothetical protein [uncultured Methanobrevibacter sp.]|uniref:hypothetical protein n=1 Tax=uncultured Methanobrevibacter sp. TaxID=253161 RepID=UPI00341A2D57